jgi:hypothetical protein
MLFNVQKIIIIYKVAVSFQEMVILHNFVIYLAITALKPKHLNFFQQLAMANILYLKMYHEILQG